MKHAAPLNINESSESLSVNMSHTYNNTHICHCHTGQGKAARCLLRQKHIRWVERPQWQTTDPEVKCISVPSIHRVQCRSSLWMRHVATRLLWDLILSLLQGAAVGSGQAGAAAHMIQLRWNINAPVFWYRRWIFVGSHASRWQTHQ